MFILKMIVINVKLKILKIGKLLLWMTLLHICGEGSRVYELRVVGRVRFVVVCRRLEKKKVDSFSNSF